MRTINKILTIGLAAFLLMMAKPQKTLAQPGVSVSFQTFYDELSPYGTWVDDPDYGDVWVPDAEEGFQPYATQGHWVMTEYGNTWVSDYEWGWAPFHYGRWRFDDYYGWEWIPGNEWGPAWVSWRTGGRYYAWAPLGPRVSVDISFGDDYSIPDDYWVCAPRAYINSPLIYNYYVPRTRLALIIRRTSIINNVYVNNNRRFIAGPHADEIERYTHNRVQVYHVNNASRPGTTIVQNNVINVYRPTIVRGNNNAERPRPATVVDANAYRNQHPNEGIANRSNGATIHHDNASRLAQTARNPEAQNSNVVRVNRPGYNAPTNGGNNAPNNNNDGGGFNRNRGNQPNTNNSAPGNNAAPTNNTVPTNPNSNNGNGNNGFYRGNRNRDNQANPNQGSQAAPTNVPNNQSPTANPNPQTVPSPAPSNPENGRFNRNRNRPTQGGIVAPNQTSPVTQQPPQQQQAQPQAQPQQSQDQQAQQQRQQQQDQARQQAIQRNQQMMQQHQQQMQQRQQQQAQPQPQQAQPQQQQAQPQQQQQRPQQQAQPQQQQVQTQQQKPQQQPQQQRQQQPQRQQPRPQPKPVEQKKEAPPVQ